MSWTCRLTLNIARSLISLSGRVFFDNSRVVWISSFQSRVCPGMCSSYPKRVEKAVKEMKNIWFKWTTEFSILAPRRQAVSKKLRVCLQSLDILTIFSPDVVYWVFGLWGHPAVDLVGGGYPLKGVLLASLLQKDTEVSLKTWTYL